MYLGTFSGFQFYTHWNHLGFLFFFNTDDATQLLIKQI